MKKSVPYQKPVAILSPECSEGVYAASGGDSRSDCFTATARIEYKPGDKYAAGHYSIRLMAHHEADHYSQKQRFVLEFNLPVKFVEQQGGGVLHGSDGSTHLEIDFDQSGYAVGPSDSPQYGYLKVDADPGLVIQSVYCLDMQKANSR